VAYRMLGSRSEADDAIQEAWLRLARADADGIQNTRAWLTTVVARVCLDVLRSRKARREVLLDAPLPADSPDPEQEAILADSVGLALLVVLDTLTPAQRLAFVLHDMFAVPFDEIAPIVGRSTQATKMLASRARHRVRTADVPNTDLSRQREVVDAFLAASRNGDFAALLDVLAPEVTVRGDAFAAAPGAPTPRARCPGCRRAGSGVLAPDQGCPHRARQRRTGNPGDTPWASRYGHDLRDHRRQDLGDRRNRRPAAPGQAHRRIGLTRIVTFLVRHLSLQLTSQTRPT
jgi:RNA polymerase sigma factor (sigma-70 family)